MAAKSYRAAVVCGMAAVRFHYFIPFFSRVRTVFRQCLLSKTKRYRSSGKHHLFLNQYYYMKPISRFAAVPS